MRYNNEYVIEKLIKNNANKIYAVLLCGKVYFTTTGVVNKRTARLATFNQDKLDELKVLIEEDIVSAAGYLRGYDASKIRKKLEQAEILKYIGPLQSTLDINNLKAEPNLLPY